MPWTLNLAYGVRWGRWFLVGSLGSLLLAALFQQLNGSAVWGLPFTGVIVAVALYVHGHMGLCHVLAGLLATPGCEMKSIPHLIARLKGQSSSLVACPGFWKNLDAWEAGRREHSVEES